MRAKEMQRHYTAREMGKKYFQLWVMNAGRVSFQYRSAARVRNAAIESITARIISQENSRRCRYRLRMRLLASPKDRRDANDIKPRPITGVLHFEVVLSLGTLPSPLPKITIPTTLWGAAGIAY